MRRVFVDILLDGNESDPLNYRWTDDYYALGAESDWELLGLTAPEPALVTYTIGLDTAEAMAAEEYRAGDEVCEFGEEADCVWVLAVARAEKTSYREEIGHLNPPVDWQLHDVASWVTVAIGRDRVVTGSDSGPHHAREVITS